MQKQLEMTDRGEVPLLQCLTLGQLCANDSDCSSLRKYQITVNWQYILEHLMSLLLRRTQPFRCFFI